MPGSRRVPAAVLGLAVCGAALRAVVHWQLTSGGALAQQTPMIIEAAAAMVIAVTTHGPFGEAERATGRWLPLLRLGAALALTGVAIALLQLGAWICAALVFAVGLGAFSLRGARSRLADEG